MLDQLPRSRAATRWAALTRAPRGAQLVWAAALLLTAWYVVRYATDPKLPGNDPALPLGWWGWFDQSMTLRSTAALAHGNFDQGQHHYPLGYSLLGLPFYLVMPNHAYAAVDLLALLAALTGFVGLARRSGLPPALAAGLFVLATASDEALFRQWVVPWNTTPVAAFVWLLLGQAAAWLDGERRPVLIGLLAGGVAACRPSDVLVMVPIFATLAWAERSTWRVRRAALLRAAAGGLAVLLPVALLHVAIYGVTGSSYLRSSAQIGFTFHDFGWKAYVLLVDPFPWFADGHGVLQRVPWVALGVAGLIPAMVAGPKSRMLAAALLVHVGLYVSYADLWPTGLWRFLNIHYFVWTFPGFALLAALLLRWLIVPGRLRLLAAASLVASGVVLCLRVTPKLVADGAPALAADFTGPLPPFFETFMYGRLALQDGHGVLRDYRDMRAILYPGGVRVLGLRRDLVGPLAWLPGHAPAGYEGTMPTARWAATLRLAWPPAWLMASPPPAIPIPEE